MGNISVVNIKMIENEDAAPNFPTNANKVDSGCKLTPESKSLNYIPYMNCVL